MICDIERVELEWVKDSKIDLTDLSTDASKILALHSKYFKVLNEAKKALRLLEAEKKKLYLLKYEFFTNTISKDELKQNDWAPNRKIILKQDVDKYIEADQQVIDLNLDIGKVNDVIDFVESIVRSLNNRPFIIRNIIENKKFEGGGY